MFGYEIKLQGLLSEEGKYFNVNISDNQTQSLDELNDKIEKLNDYNKNSDIRKLIEEGLKKTSNKK